jgi:hypothetical protein
MITDNLLYYIAICYNFTAEKCNSLLEYLEGVTERVNKVIVGEPIEWLLFGNGSNCIRKADIAPVNFPFVVGQLYNPVMGTFLELKNLTSRQEEYKKFEYIGGELRFMNNKYDITDWLNNQRWSGSSAPSAKFIASAWLIKNSLLGLMAYKEWEEAELNLVDSCGDDLIVKMTT